MPLKLSVNDTMLSPSWRFCHFTLDTNFNTYTNIYIMPGSVIYLDNPLLTPCDNGVTPCDNRVTPCENGVTPCDNGVTPCDNRVVFGREPDETVTFNMVYFPIMVPIRNGFRRTPFIAPSLYI
jgi:hypothetical protein